VSLLYCVSSVFYFCIYFIAPRSYFSNNLEAHPEVAQFFKQAGVFSYCEKLANFHQQVAEAFAISYDGRSAKIGKEEFIIDEDAIAEYTSLPRLGDCWFKSTTPSNIEFRSYLLPLHKDLI
jgi:hypothetical protein